MFENEETEVPDVYEASERCLQCSELIVANGTSYRQAKKNLRVIKEKKHNCTGNEGGGLNATG